MDTIQVQGERGKEKKKENVMDEEVRRGGGYIVQVEREQRTDNEHAR